MPPTLPQPDQYPADLYDNVASILRSYCGRDPADETLQGCSHDHRGDAVGMVAMIAAAVVPLALNELLMCTKAEGIPRAVIEARINKIKKSVPGVSAR